MRLICWWLHRGQWTYEFEWGPSWRGAKVVATCRKCGRRHVLEGPHD